MFLPTELLSPATVNTATTGHLLKAIDREGALLWILEAEDVRFAVFLTGEFAKRAFEIRPDSGGAGCLIGPVKVRVDPSSVSNRGDDWSMKAKAGSLHFGFQAEKRGGFPEHLWASVGAIEAVDDFQVYFARWSAGVEIDGGWAELVSVADGQLTTTLAVEGQTNG